MIAGISSKRARRFASRVSLFAGAMMMAVPAQADELRDAVAADMPA